MRIKQIAPNASGSVAEGCCYCLASRLLVGRCYDNQDWTSFLSFPLPSLSISETLRRATLTMRCLSYSEKPRPDMVTVQESPASIAQVKNGQYIWDLTRAVRRRLDGDIRLHLCAGPSLPAGAYVEFVSPKVCACPGGPALPVLTLSTGGLCMPLPTGHPGGMVNIVKDYAYSCRPQQSDWIECLSLSRYYYFIQNMSPETVRVWVQISPDRNMSFTDSGPFDIEADRTLQIQPLRESRFIRLRFQSVSGQEGELPPTGLMRTWFQGCRLSGAAAGK